MKEIESIRLSEFFKEVNEPVYVLGTTYTLIAASVPATDRRELLFSGAAVCV